MADGIMAINTRRVALNRIAPDPNQPRKHFDEEALETLAASIRQHGVIQPIIIRPAPSGADGQATIDEFWIIAGERRWRASGKAGLITIPATIREDLSDSDIEVLQVVENLQRQDLTLPETAAGVAKLVATIGNDEAARQLGMSEAWVSKHARVATVHEDVLDLVNRGKITSADIAHDLSTLLELAPDTYWVNTTMASARTGTLTRADLRRNLQSAKSEIQREKERIEQRAAELAQAQQRIENADIEDIEVDQLDLEELDELEKKLDEMPLEKAAAILLVREKISLERQAHADEEAADEKRQLLNARFKQFEDELIPVQLGLAKRLYERFDLRLPTIDGTYYGDLIAEGVDVLFGHHQSPIFEYGADVATPVTMSTHLPNSWSVQRNQAVAPESLEDCQVGLEIVLPLSRMRELVELLTSNQAPAPVAVPSKELTPLEAFLSECVDRSDQEARLNGGVLLDRFSDWCRENKLKPLSGNNFAKAMEELGVKRHRFNDGRAYMGCKLIPQAARKALLKPAARRGSTAPAGLI